MSPTVTPTRRKAMKATQSIYSIGQAAAMVRALPERIRSAAATLNLQPTLRINGVDHFTEADIERIGEHLRQPTSTKAKQ